MSVGQSRSSKINHVLDSSLNSRTLTQVKMNVYLTNKSHNITHISFFLKYQRDWKRWTAYCNEKSIELFEASPQTVLTFFSTLNVGISRTYTFLSSISHHYRRNGYQSPCDDPLVKMYMRGLQRLESTK